MVQDLIPALFFIVIAIIISAYTAGFERKLYLIRVSLLGAIIIMTLHFVMLAWWLEFPLLFIILFIEARFAADLYYKFHGSLANLRKKILIVSTAVPLVTILFFWGSNNIWYVLTFCYDCSALLGPPTMLVPLAICPPMLLICILLGVFARRSIINKYHLDRIAEVSGNDLHLRLDGDSSTDAPPPEGEKKKKPKGK